MNGRLLLAPLFLSLIGATFLFAAPADDSLTSIPPVVVVFILDGVRPEEFFSGSDPLLSRTKAYREELFPFLAQELADDPNVTVLGLPDSPCTTTNPHGISLPAYADLLSGTRQTSVSSNDFRGRIGHDTLLDRMNANDVAADSVSVFTSWKNIGRVAARDAAPFLVEAGRQKGDAEPPWADARYDKDTMASVHQYLDRAVLPRFLFVALNDADEWAHRGDYAAYLEAIRRQDAAVRRLFMRLPKDRTVLFVTTDHGRGRGQGWRYHGAAWPGSENIWALIRIPESLRKRYGVELAGAVCNHITLSHAFEEFLHSEKNAPLAGVRSSFSAF